MCSYTQHIALFCYYLLHPSGSTLLSCQVVPDLALRSSFVRTLAVVRHYPTILLFHEACACVRTTLQEPHDNVHNSSQAREQRGTVSAALLFVASRPYRPNFQAIPIICNPKNDDSGGGQSRCDDTFLGRRYRRHSDAPLTPALCNPYSFNSPTALTLMSRVGGSENEAKSWYAKRNHSISLLLV